MIGFQDNEAKITKKLAWHMKNKRKRNTGQPQVICNENKLVLTFNKQGK